MRLFFTYLLFIFSFHVCADVRLSEVMQANVNSVLDDLNNFPEGWVELYNDGGTPVSLKNYALAKKNKPEKAYQLPDTLLQPNSYLLVYCDEVCNGVHTDFQLPVNKSGSIYLFRNRLLADSVNLQPVLASNISYSRMADGLWYFVSRPTPMLANDRAEVESAVPSPIFSVPGGVKTEDFVLRLQLPSEAPSGARILYAVDGSAPIDSSNVYNTPININKSVVVRAKVVAEGWADSPIVTQSYLFLNRQQTLPIVSLVGDSDYFFGNEHGIYVRGTYGTTHPNSTPKVTVFGRSNYYYDWGRPVNFEFFPLNTDTAVLNQWCEVKIGGTATRRLPVKSLVVKADKLFGCKTFNYSFFPDKPQLKSVKSVMLRNSGQDMAYTFLRDAFMQGSFARHTHIDYLAYQPAMLFINGQYFGLRNIRERSNNDFIKSNYGLSEGDYDLISNFNGRVEVGDSSAFLQFKKIYTDSLSTYEQLDALMDIDEFLDYLVMNSFYCNTDFPGNNMLMWKSKTLESKWRWIAKDMDFGMGRSSSPYNLNYLNFILRKEPFLNRGTFNSETACQLFEKMMSLARSRQAFIDRASVYMGTFASPGSLGNLLDSLAANIDYEMPFFSEFRGKDEDDWQSALSDAKNWLDKRVPYFYSDLSRFFKIGNSVPLQIHTKGKCYFNNLSMPSGQFDGQYFESRRIYLSTDSITDFDTDEFHKQEPRKKAPVEFKEWIGDYWQLGNPQYGNYPDMQWQVQYVRGDSLITELYDDKDLDWTIPSGATSVCINQNSCEVNVKSVLDNSHIIFAAYDLNGRQVAKGSYSWVFSKLKQDQNYILSSFNGKKKINTVKLRQVN